VNYENVDTLYDALGVYGAESMGDQYYEGLLIKTLQRLPSDVREKTIDEVIFFIAGGVRGTYIALNVTYRSVLHFILLNFCDMFNMNEQEIMTVIAHEIAHFILGHIMAGGLDHEKEADDLCEKWGFGRAYKNNIIGKN